MQPIVKFVLTKAGISSTLHTAVIYVPRSLGVIFPFDIFVIQGAGQIDFLVEQFWKSTPYRPLICVNLYTLQLEAVRGECILENKYHETQQCLHTD